MARRCDLTGKKAQFGHNVAHSNLKTNRRFSPNLQKVSLQSDALGRTVRLRVSTRALRSVQHNGGLDPYLISRRDAQLAPEGLRLKRRVRKALTGKPASAAAAASN